MSLTPRRRALVVVVLALFAGWLYLGWALQLAADVGRVVQGRGFSACSYTPWHSLGYSCPTTFSPGTTLTASVQLVVVTALVALLFWGLARWVLQPLRAITGSIEALGPQNLGERARVSGPHDETRRLGDAIDAMLDRLAEGYESQRSFAANASHELRTPLAVQRTLVEVGLAVTPTEEQRELLVRQLLATNERNEQLVESLLVLAETERGLVSRSGQRLDAVAAEAVTVLADQAAVAGVTLHCRADEPVEVAGELALLDRLVGNLVQNAIKYNVPGGAVEVQVGPPGWVRVVNTGPVVPASAVSGLFEPFRRLGGRRIDHSGGAGLGLTIARSIVRAHGATITAQANPGGGLSVVVEFAAHQGRLAGAGPVGGAV